MKSFKSLHFLAACLSIVAAQAVAQPTADGKAPDARAVQQQNEYTEQLRNAQAEQERKEIQTRQREAGQAASKAHMGHGNSGQANQGGQGHGVAKPAGNKNKSQKSGR